MLLPTSMHYCLAINPVISTRCLLDEFKKHNYKIIALMTTRHLSEYYAKDFHKNDFHKIIYLSNHLEQDGPMLAKQLAGYDIDFGFIGSEKVLPYGDKVLAMLFPDHSNDPKTSVYRYQKYAMNKRLREVNLPWIEQILINADAPTNWLEIEAFIDRHPLLIVKPNQDSNCSEDVEKITSIDELNIYLQQRTSAYGKTPNILLQQCVTGDEYFVDTFSYDGKHYTTAVFRYGKAMIDNKPVYQYVDILHAGQMESQRLTVFNEQVLNALNVNYGFSHTEYMGDGEHFNLIELNPRISGISNQPNYLSLKKYGITQPSICCNILRNHPIKRTHCEKHYRIVVLNDLGFSYDKINRDVFTTLKTFDSIRVLKERNSGVDSLTLSNTLAFIVLADSNFANLERDSNLIRNIERTGGYIS